MCPTLPDLYFDGTFYKSCSLEKTQYSDLHDALVLSQYTIDDNFYFSDILILIKASQNLQHKIPNFLCTGTLSKHILKLQMDKRDTGS